ncbi:hypothetical protein Tco_0964758 [Tanacetum coccineum]
MLFLRQKLLPMLKLGNMRSFKGLLVDLVNSGVGYSPEDLNVNYKEALPPEWDTHVVVWMNKPDFDTMGLDDLYNNFKIVEQKNLRKLGRMHDAPIIEDWVSDDEDEVESPVMVKKKTVIPTAAKIEKPVRKPVSYAEMYRSPRPRGNQRN